MAAESPHVRVGVGVFLLKSSRESLENPSFLVGKRIGSHGAGTLALPGGHLEFGETPEDCAARELLEETGVKVANVQFLTATNDRMPAENKHYVTLFMVCAREEDQQEPQVLEPNKCEAWEWMTWEELKALAKNESESNSEDVVDRKLFIPLFNAVTQRPEAIPSLQRP